LKHGFIFENFTKSRVSFFLKKIKHFEKNKRFGLTIAQNLITIKIRVKKIMNFLVIILFFAMIIAFR